MPDHVKNTKTKQNSQRKGALRLEPCHCDNMRMPPWLTGKKCTWCCVRLLRAQRADKERDGGRLVAGAAWLHVQSVFLKNGIRIDNHIHKHPQPLSHPQHDTYVRIAPRFGSTERAKPQSPPLLSIIRHSSIYIEHVQNHTSVAF